MYLDGRRRLLPSGYGHNPRSGRYRIRHKISAYDGHLEEIRNNGPREQLWSWGRLFVLVLENLACSRDLHCKIQPPHRMPKSDRLLPCRCMLAPARATLEVGPKISSRGKWHCVL